MHTSRLARRRLRVGAVLIGLCLAAGSVGNAALASRNNGSNPDSPPPSNSNPGTAITIEADLLVQAGMTPLGARQAARNLNAAIDAAAQTVARSAATALPSRRPVRNTATAIRAFADEIDASLSGFVAQSVPALRAAGARTDQLVDGTLAALAQIVRALPGAVAVTTGAEIAIAGGADSTSVAASVSPVVDPAVRRSISGSVAALRPILPLTRTTLRTVAAGVRQVVDASVVAVNRVVDATVDFTVAVLTVTASMATALQAGADDTIAATNSIVSAVDDTLDNLSDVNNSAQVDASLSVNAG